MTSCHIMLYCRFQVKSIYLFSVFLQKRSLKSDHDFSPSFLKVRFLAKLSNRFETAFTLPLSNCVRVNFNQSDVDYDNCFEMICLKS